MNKTLVITFALGAAMLTSCSSDPSDLRADTKVSVDQVPPGTRDTDIYNLNGGEDVGHTGGHGTSNEPAAHGEQQRETPAENNERQDVMPNHDEHNNDLSNKDVPAADKTTDADHVQPHE